MRMLLFHCKRIRFEDVRRSKRPKGIIPNSKVSQKFSNTLVAFICVEKWDNKPEYITKAVKIIWDHLHLIKRNRVVITPFAHLSNYLAPFKVATTVLDNIGRELKDKGVEVGKASFGYHKRIKTLLKDAEVYGHPGSVAYRRIPDDLEIELQHIVAEEGFKRTYETLRKMQMKNQGR
jgi:threonyl-tRNA synthetase